MYGHVPLATLVKVAGRRWTVEDRLPRRQGLADLDEHQVRRSDSWYHWVTLAMLAAAFLHHRRRRARHRPAANGQIPLIRNEISRLFATLIIWPLRDLWHRLGLSG